MALRVHGGEARGRRLRAPAGVRPTQGVVKEAIFNILGSRVEGAIVLDLFAGSGALGIEALSRGAAFVTFVDRAQACASILRQNLEALGYADRSRSARSEVTGWLASHSEDVSRADILFMDPPYRDPVLARALAILDGIVGARGTVVVEHGRGEELPALDRLHGGPPRRYGGTLISMLTLR